MKPEHFIKLISALAGLSAVILFMIVCECFILLTPESLYKNIFVPARLEASMEVVDAPADTLWQAPDSLAVPDGPDGDLIRYGRELIAHTSVYLGPNGSVSQTTNGMNCQNCHLKGGTKLFGNNYSAVYSTYPQVRSRSGTLVTIEERVNGCIERSLNGTRLDTTSKEMLAIKRYFQWVGQQVPKGVKPNGAGIWKLPFLDRPADPDKGRVVYEVVCQRCHGPNGEGMPMVGSNQWLYPPLWGDGSYNTGAGLYRLTNFSGYVKMNMPFGVNFDNPELTDEQAWDVAAYVNSMPRPQKDFPRDWPDINKKPFDHPFGPYADTFPESRHKYGPFAELQRRAAARK